MRIAAISLFCVLLAALAGCEQDGGVLCAAYIHPAVEVEIRDAQSNAPLAEDATGEIVNGDFHAPLDPAGGDANGLYSRAGYGPAGTYVVTVNHDGYQAWTQSGVVVRNGVCGVDTVQLQALLTPATN